MFSSSHAARKFVEFFCERMKVGEEVVVDSRHFKQAYPCGWPTIYKTPEQAFLSSKVGAAWGVWRVRRSFAPRDFVISKHEESDKRHYVDPDREDLFKKMPDGTLELK